MQERQQAAAHVPPEEGVIMLVLTYCGSLGLFKLLALAHRPVLRAHLKMYSRNQTAQARSLTDINAR